MAKKIEVKFNESKSFETEPDANSLVERTINSKTLLKRLPKVFLIGLQERIREFSWTRNFFRNKRALKTVHIIILAFCLIFGSVGGCGEALVQGAQARGWADRMGLSTIVALITLSFSLALAVGLATCGEVYLYPVTGAGVALLFVVRAAVLLHSQQSLYGDWAVTSALTLFLVVYLAEPLLLSSFIVELLIRPLVFAFNTLFDRISQCRRQTPKTTHISCWKKFSAMVTRQNNGTYIHVKSKGQDDRCSSWSSMSSTDSLMAMALEQQQAQQQQQRARKQRRFWRRWGERVKKWALHRLRDYAFTSAFLLDEAKLRPCHLGVLTGCHLCGMAAAAGVLLRYCGTSEAYDSRAIHNLVSNGALASLAALLPTALFTGLISKARHRTPAPAPLLRVGVGTSPVVVTIQLGGFVYLGVCVAVLVMAAQHFTAHCTGTWALIFLFGTLLTVVVIEPIFLPALLCEILLYPVKRIIRYCMRDLTPEHLQSPWARRLYLFTVPTKYFWRQLSKVQFSFAVLGLILGLLAASSQATALVASDSVVHRLVAGVCSAACTLILSVVAGVAMVKGLYFYALAYAALCLYLIISALMRFTPQEMLDWFEIFGFSLPSLIYLGELRLFVLVLVQIVRSCLHTITKPIRSLHARLSPAPVATQIQEPKEPLEPSDIELAPSLSPGDSRPAGSCTGEETKEAFPIFVVDADQKDVEGGAKCSWCQASFAEDELSSHEKACGKKLRQCPNCSKHFPSTNFKHHLLHGCPMRGASCSKCGRSVRAGALATHLQKKCPFRTVQCSQCHGRLPFSSLSLHKKAHCPKRPVPCPKCYEDVPWYQMQDHELTGCHRRIWQCPLCHEHVEFGEQQHHEQSLCPLRITRCLRCGEELPFIAMEGHNEEGCPMRPSRCDLCGKAVPLAYFKSHCEQKCPQLPASCEKCGEKMPKAQLATHVLNDCQKRSKQCLKCSEVVELSSLENHLANSCPQRLVQCPGCQEFVRALFLSDHCRDVCPARMVPCPEGCEEKLKITSISSHISKKCNIGLFHCKCGEEVPLSQREEHLGTCDDFKRTWSSLIAKVVKLNGPINLVQELKLIKSVTGVPTEIALCALAECHGDKKNAIKKLKQSSTYRKEMSVAAVACNAKKYIRKKT